MFTELQIRCILQVAKEIFHPDKLGKQISPCPKTLGDWEAFFKDTDYGYISYGLPEDVYQILNTLPLRLGELVPNVLDITLKLYENRPSCKIIFSWLQQHHEEMNHYYLILNYNSFRNLISCMEKYMEYDLFRCLQDDMEWFYTQDSTQFWVSIPIGKTMSELLIQEKIGEIIVNSALTDKEYPSFRHIIDKTKIKYRIFMNLTSLYVFFILAKDISKLYYDNIPSSEIDAYQFFGGDVLEDLFSQLEI